MVKFSLLTIICWMVAVPCFSQGKSPVKVEEMNFNQLEPYLHLSNDTVYLINFWATWCIPCREEIPALVAVNNKYSKKKFREIFVSLDFPKQVSSSLVPFAKSNKMPSPIILLNDPDQNNWIDKVDSSWSGAIPFTLIYGKHFRESYPHPFLFNELDSIINLKLK